MDFPKVASHEVEVPLGPVRRWPVFAYLYFSDGSQLTAQNYGHYHERYRRRSSELTT
jgi:hypothetical protein